MAKKSKKSGLSSTQKIEIGVGLTTAAVAAAGAYFLYGSKNSAKNRKKIKSWMLKAKAEVLEGLEDAKEMTEAEYEMLVNSVVGTYATLKTATNVDVNDFKKEMMQHWKNIEKAAPVRKMAKKVTKKKPAKKASKKTTKKVVKKTTKKPAKKTTKKVAKKSPKKVTKKKK